MSCMIMLCGHDHFTYIEEIMLVFFRHTIVYFFKPPTLIAMANYVCILSCAWSVFLLTHLGRDKMDATLQTTFSSSFSWMKIFDFRLKISLKFVPKGLIKTIPALVQIMAWRRQGDKPLSEPMMVRLPMYICVARPQWVKPSRLSDTHIHHITMTSCWARWGLKSAVYRLFTQHKEPVTLKMFPFDDVVMSKLVHHWFRWWFAACSAPSHFWTNACLGSFLTLDNKHIFHRRELIQNCVCKVAANFSRLQCIICNCCTLSHMGLSLNVIQSARP